MTLVAYNRTFFSLLGVGLACLVVMMAITILASQSRREEKKVFATAGMTALGVAFVFNIACGIQHKKMRSGWGTVASQEKSGGTFYVIDIPMNIVIVLMLFYIAVQTWRGVISIAL